MFIHVVLFRWKDAIDDETVKAIFDELIAVTTAMPGVVSAQAGPRISDAASPWTHGLVIDFETLEDLQRYLADTEHRRIVVESILPAKEELLSFDFQVA